ncbi:hypothetical protein N7478_009803 [Penicillium angulare]|uniref:uncharacterized protein n=1 Tax=Penicillium angulare TaxID=116970 RepID=UPI00253F7809|nr:uncharacterized protein N7478_009803 [Penicillium angulare]KAJ5266995.1 hypothetical protein N7478_009803 [Penicillium angulare]
MDTSTHMINIAGAIALTCTTLMIVVSVIYVAGASLGFIFGRFILQYLPQIVPDTRNRQPQDQDQNSSQPVPFNHRSLQDRNARILGATFAFCFFFAALMTESYLEGLKDVNGEADGWDIWRANGVLIRACVEGLLVLAILRGAGCIGQRIRNFL